MEKNIENIHPETLKEFEDLLRKLWGKHKKAVQDVDDEIIHFISTHFIDKRALQEELDEMKKHDGIEVFNEKGEFRRKRTNKEYNQDLQDIKDKLL